MSTCSNLLQDNNFGAGRFLVPHKARDDCSQRCLIALEACDHRSEESIRIKPLKIDGMTGLICQQEEE